ncbi:hypothetical protein JJ691_19260 [Kutzneria sp. CA-103260]|nr:hypothetical protein JJ691_19260 [Kutzneria sp. CA-103260]
MGSTMGEDYQIGPTGTVSSRGTQCQIRVTDAADAPLAGNRICRFALPSPCANGCGPAYTAVAYTTSWVNTASLPPAYVCGNTEVRYVPPLDNVVVWGAA